MNKIFPVTILLLFASLLVNGQNDKTEYANNTFEGTRVVVGHSIEMLKEGEMELLISHKFGKINGGAYEFFGLDQAIMRLGLDYAIKDWVTIGIGRSTLDKQVDAFAKFRIFRQKKGASNFPVSLTGLTTASAILLKVADPTQPIHFQDRLAYTFQIFAARQFNSRFSLQIVPTLTHYNLVEKRDFPNDIISFGGAAKYQLTKVLALKAEYYYTLPLQFDTERTNSLAIGVDIDTGSHVFQLHFSNSGGLTEPAFIGNTRGKWLKGDIHFGFTMSRVFKLKGRRY
ncbi:MAG TPA: hypothetical protein ENJ53_03505 [Phaeodactylibacter sp.]|nr:hypothetical protein [Phaeodactylibacter sp.]